MRNYDPIRVHLVSADFLLYQGLRTVLAPLEYLILEALTESKDDAVGAVVNSDPDIVLMVRQPHGMDGLAVTRTIVEQAPRTKVVMLSSETDQQSMIDVYQAGAASYLARTQITEDLGPALRMIHRGATILAMPPETPRLQSIGAVREKPKPALDTVLNCRERRLLTAVVSGKTNADIGRELHVSEATIKAHLTGLLKRLNVSNRVQLAVLTVRSDLTDNSGPGPQLAESR